MSLKRFRFWKLSMVRSQNLLTCVFGRVYVSGNVCLAEIFCKLLNEMPLFGGKNTLA